MSGASVREPFVAGRFYPDEPGDLAREVARCFGGAVPDLDTGTPAIGAIVPHAGYRYSGRVAGATLGECRVPLRAIVLCPNHTGRGARRAVHLQGSWRLPDGEIPVDQDLGRSLFDQAGLDDDVEAHRAEHAIEVELPLLAARNPALRMVPICLARLTYAECERLGRAIARTVAEAGGPQQILLVASTDLSHYLREDQAHRVDPLVIEPMTALDPEGLYRTVVERRISMCGFIPTTVVLVAARALGARRARLVRYATSADVTGDRDRVVGYAGLLIEGLEGTGSGLDLGPAFG